jgi:hypothetical protein
MIKKARSHSSKLFAVTTTEQLGRAMIDVAARGYERPILETSDINRLR